MRRYDTNRPANDTTGRLPSGASKSYLSRRTLAGAVTRNRSTAYGSWPNSRIRANLDRRISRTDVSSAMQWASLLNAHDGHEVRPFSGQHARMRRHVPGNGRLGSGRNTSSLRRLRLRWRPNGWRRPWRWGVSEQGPHNLCGRDRLSGGLVRQAWETARFSLSRSMEARVTADRTAIAAFCALQPRLVPPRQALTRLRTKSPFQSERKRSSCQSWSTRSRSRLPAARGVK